MLDQEAEGALKANLFAGVAVGLVSIGLMLRRSSLRTSRRLLTASLVFSLPLLPNSLSQWLLHLSDRVVIEPYVSGRDLGLYSLAYSVGTLALLFVFAFSKALGPVILRQLKDERTAAQVPRVGTYSLAVLAYVCLAIALMGSPMVRLATPPSFHGAIDLIPWLAAGQLCVAIYTIVSQGAWFAMKTAWIAFGTIAAGVINVGLNLLLVPPFGITAAAIATMLGFLSLALIQGVIARRLYRIPWEYGRCAKLLAVAGAAFAFGWVAGSDELDKDVLVKAVALAVVFPGLLVLVRFFRPEEWRWLRGSARSLRGRVRRS